VIATMALCHTSPSPADQVSVANPVTASNINMFLKGETS
jgi:hypothetical protein